MADALLAITSEYVRCFLALIGKDIWWPEAVRQKLLKQGLSPLDVTYVMTHGQVRESEKESAHGTAFVMIGTTCDDVQIRVEFWADPNEVTLRVVDVEVI